MVRIILALFLFVIPAIAPAAIPTPDDFAGFPIGSDGNLMRWDKIVEYFRLLDSESDRIQVRQMGETHNGNPFIVATISSPENLAKLDQIQQTQRRVAYPEGLTESEIDRIVEESPAVVMVSCNIHSTEIGASQMAVELAHDMATSGTPWMQRVLDNVVFVLVPSLNPDGQIMITDWNNRIRGTKHAWASLPYLYHPYVGHDNNRDAYMMTQPESRFMNQLLFQEWFPQVYIDEHQQGNSGMRVFVPPFSNPINPNVDPAIWATAGKIGFAMYQALHEAGIDGVGYDARYTAWWQGGFLRGAWFHNIVGMLTEVASANLGMPVVQEKAELGKRPPVRSSSEWEKARVEDPEAPMPPPRDTMPRYDYPRPWLGGRWTLRDIIDSELALTRATLELAADQRRRLVRTQIRMGLDAIEAGKQGEPWAYVFPADQHDPGAVYTLLELLHFTGVEVHRAESAFTAGGKEYPAGSHVVLMAQPFRAYAKDLLEAQEHPDPAAMPPGKMADQPYDSTAWTLPLQMGVETVRVDNAFDASLTELDAIEPPKGTITGSGDAGVLIKAGPNRLATLVNRLHKAEAAVSLLGRRTGEFPAGSVWVADPPAGFEGWVQELGLAGFRLAAAPIDLQPLRPVRVALYRPFTASMDEGWTRWLLEQYEFPITPVFNDDLQTEDLRADWDVILLPGDRSDSRLMQGANDPETPEEYKGGLEQEGREAIREFVAEGGRLVVWHDAVEFALRTFELPLKDALKRTPRSQFSCPGCFVRIQVDPNQPIGYGMPREGVAVFDDDAAFEPLPAFTFTDFDVVARYPGDDLLQSGWIRGPEHLHHRIAVVDADYQDGSVVMIAFRPQFRAQPHNTFKLLFNAIHTAGLEPR